MNSALQDSRITRFIEYGPRRTIQMRHHSSYMQGRIHSTVIAAMPHLRNYQLLTQRYDIISKNKVYNLLSGYSLDI